MYEEDVETAPGNNRRWSKFRIVAVSILIVLAGYGIERRWERVRSLDNVLSSADRIEITSGDTRAAPFVPVEINGRDEVDRLLGIVEIEAFVPQCKCYGDIQLSFFRGSHRLTTIGIAHNERLKWHKGNWPSDAKLTEKSRTAIDAWLKERIPAA